MDKPAPGRRRFIKTGLAGLAGAAMKTQAGASWDRDAARSAMDIFQLKAVPEEFLV